MNKLPEKKSNFEGRACQHMDKTETIALYGSYVYRCGSLLYGWHRQTINLLRQMMWQ